MARHACDLRHRQYRPGGGGCLWFYTPRGVSGLHGGRISRAGLVRALVDKQLWIYGIAMLGVYGAYFTASQLFSEYAVAQRGFTPGQGGLLAAILALAGIPGSLVGGKVADLARNYRSVIVVPLLLMGALIAAIPVAPDALLCSSPSRSGSSSSSATRLGWVCPRTCRGSIPNRSAPRSA